MATDCTLTVTGNVTSEPELRFTPSGTPSLGFSLARNRRWQNKQTQEWEEETDFFNVQVWNKLAENAAETLTKGMRVTVVGSIKQDNWEDKDTKQKRSALKVIADEIGPSLKWATAKVDKNPKGEGGGRQAPEPPAGFAYDEEPF